MTCHLQAVSWAQCPLVVGQDSGGCRASHGEGHTSAYRRVEGPKVASFMRPERRFRLPLLTTRSGVRNSLREPNAQELTQRVVLVYSEPRAERLQGFRVSARNHGPFLTSRPRRCALCFASGQKHRQGLPLLSNSNRFKLSDSPVDNPQLVDAGGAVGRASAIRLQTPVAPQRLLPCVMVTQFYSSRSLASGSGSPCSGGVTKRSDSVAGVAA